jgi:hypothetical protein
MRKLDLIWKRFWSVVVISEASVPEWRRKSSYWNCVCDCWNEVRIIWSGLKVYKHCPRCPRLYTRKHWLSHERINEIYKKISSRCNNKNNIGYYLYWWRWIKNLRKNFNEFLDDMYSDYLKHVEEYWEKNTSIDRIDNDWNYCKDNCKWATPKEQANNKRNNVNITYKWETKTLMQWSEYLNIKYNILQSRYYAWRCDYDILLWKQ